MANDYFNHVTNVIQAGVRALAAQINNIAAEISTGLDKLPTEQQLKLGLTRYAVDTGAADAYVLTMPFTPTLTDGFNLLFKAVNANTGPSTVNVNGLGIKSIVNPDGGALVAGTFGANAIVIIAYEAVGDRFILVSQNPGQAALAAASAAAADASETAAGISETNAGISESNASASAGAASTSEINAGVSEVNAAASAAAAAAAYDDFDDRYLGAKASDPALDNDGDALITGAIYFNTGSNEMLVYNGSAWQAFSTGGDAATLDGLDSTQFLRSDVTDDMFSSSFKTLGIQNTNSSGVGLEVVASGNAANFVSSTTDRIICDVNTSSIFTGAAFRAAIFNAGSSGSVIEVNNEGTGNALFINGDGDNKAINILSSAAQATIIEIVANSLDTGDGLVISANSDNMSGALIQSSIQSGVGTSNAVAGRFTHIGTGLAIDCVGNMAISGNIGFYNTTPIAKPTVTGSRGGNAALADLLTELANLGLITDSST